MNLAATWVNLAGRCFRCFCFSKSKSCDFQNAARKLLAGLYSMEPNGVPWGQKNEGLGNKRHIKCPRKLIVSNNSVTPWEIIKIKGLGPDWYPPTFPWPKVPEGRRFFQPRPWSFLAMRRIAGFKIWGTPWDNLGPINWWTSWSIFQVQLRFCNMNSKGLVEMLQLGVVQVGMQPQVGRHDTQGSTLNLLPPEGRAKKWPAVWNGLAHPSSLHRKVTDSHGNKYLKFCSTWKLWHIECYCLSYKTVRVVRCRAVKGGRTPWQDHIPVGHNEKIWANENISCKHPMVLWVKISIFAIHTLEPWVVAIHNLGLKHALLTTSTKHVHCTYLDA